MNPHALAMVKLFEGCKLVAYKDVGGILTIGYGHTAGVVEGDTITQKAAENFLIADLKKTECGVINLVNVPLSCHAMGALIDFTFNVGLGAFKTSSLLKKVNAKDVTAADEFLRWIYVKNVAIKGLLRRRQEERKLFLLPHNI